MKYFWKEQTGILWIIGLFIVLTLTPLAAIFIFMLDGAIMALTNAVFFKGNISHPTLNVIVNLTLTGITALLYFLARRKGFIYFLSVCILFFFTCFLAFAVGDQFPESDWNLFFPALVAVLSGIILLSITYIKWLRNKKPR